jgi:hypothetical protein
MKKQAQQASIYSPVRREVVSPADFLRISKDKPHLIARSRFIAPTIGRKDFGSFEIQYTVPLLKQAEHA